MELRLLRSFVAVAEELHFGRAARRLHISQPPLSNQIRQLESELGVLLFERSRRHVALTNGGRELLGRARHLLAETERARSEVQRVARGESEVLKIGYTPTATYDVLPRLVPRFRARRPDIRLEFAEMRSPLVPEAIRTGRIDVGFVCAPVDCRGLEESVIARERPFLALPSKHPLASRPRVPAAALGREPFVAVDSHVEPGWAETALRALHDKGIEPRVVQVTDTKLAMLGLVAAGIGVSIVSESMAHLARSGVALRPLAGVRLRFALCVLFTKSPSPPAADLLALI